MSICTLPTSESAKPKYHQAHAVGTAVTALLSHIDGQLCRIDSGGEDFAVVIWNLKDNRYHYFIAVLMIKLPAPIGSIQCAQWSCHQIV